MKTSAGRCVTACRGAPACGEMRVGTLARSKPAGCTHNVLPHVGFAGVWVVDAFNRLLYLS